MSTATTRSNTDKQEGNEAEQTSPHQTRSKRKKENQIEDPREYQDTASLTIKEKPLKIQVGYCYLVSLSNKVGWLRIDKMWMFDNILKMEATCFTKPNSWKCKRSECGEDQLIAHNAKILLNADRFKRMYINKENPNNQSGSHPIPLTAIVKREKETSTSTYTSTYFQMKNSKFDITENVSASAVVHDLGFARFNAGAKKKTMLPRTPNRSSKHKGSEKASENVALVLSYKEYCLHRKLKKLLEAGGIASDAECERYHVVSKEENIKVFYTKPVSYTPQEDWVEVMDGIDDLMFEKFSKDSKEADARLKRQTGKYRRQTL